MSYEQMIDNLDQQIARLNTAKAALLALLLPTTTKAEKPRTKGRAKSGGSDAVVLSAIRDGAETPKAIAEAAKIKLHNVSYVLKRLMEAKRVTATGHTSQRRYRLTK